MTKKSLPATDNVLIDLGIPDAETVSAKLLAAIELNRILDNRKLTQAAIGKLLALPQSKVSLLRNFKVDHFSLEKILGFLSALNRDIEISVRKPTNTRRKGRITLLAA
jgi:predicted XRE-type DNA-binding protein